MTGDRGNLRRSFPVLQCAVERCRALQCATSVRVLRHPAVCGRLFEMQRGVRDSKESRYSPKEATGTHF